MTEVPQPPNDARPPFRNPDEVDMGCVVGLAMALIVLPVSLFMGAVLATLGILAAVAAWGGMRLTPRKIRDSWGVGRVWLAWFIFLLLIEVGVACYIKYATRHGGEFTRPQSEAVESH